MNIDPFTEKRIINLKKEILNQMEEKLEQDDKDSINIITGSLYGISRTLKILGIELKETL